MGTLAIGGQKFARGVMRMVLGFALWLVVPPGHAQPLSKYSVPEKRAVEQYNAGVSKLNLGEVDAAIEVLSRLLARHPEFIEAHLQLARGYEEKRDLRSARDEYVRAIAIDSAFFPLAYLNAGRLSFLINDFAQARDLLIRYLRLDGQKEKNRQHAQIYLQNARYSAWALAHPVDVSPEALSPAVNTELDEYFPSLSADSKWLCFTRLLRVEAGKQPRDFGDWQEDLHMAYRSSDTLPWGQSQSLGQPISTYMNEGSQSLSADGMEMYFTQCWGTCKIFHTQRDARGRWAMPTILPFPVNMQGTSSKQPSVSPDGQRLYFTSARKGGLGGLDIWVALRDGNGRWSRVVNLGPRINTPFDEQSPFIHFDNTTLYFASEGHPGLGGLDLFLSRRADDTTWTSPVNLGYPINTHSTDMGLVVTSTGDSAYYASDRNQANGLDLYRFAVPESLRPTPSSYLRGTVQDALNGFPLQAEVVLIDLANQDTVMQLRTNEQGRFLVCIPTGRSYALFAACPGYFDYSGHFDMKGIHSQSKPFRQVIGLLRMEPNITLTLRNVFFATDSDELSVASHLELDRWISLMRQRPGMRLEIIGHTDSVGTDEYNRKLSLRRARNVARYLERGGISAGRIQSTGLGASQPVGRNDTKEGRAQNRRTECRVLQL